MRVFLCLYMLGNYKCILCWQWGVLPLCDNILTDTCFYEITVYTGMRRGAGTRSNISFVLAGDYADTGVRQLKDIKGAKVMLNS